MELSSYTIEVTDCLTSATEVETIDKNHGFVTCTNRTSSARDYKIEVMICGQGIFDWIDRANDVVIQYGGIVNENPTYKVAIAYNVPNHSNHTYPAT